MWLAKTGADCPSVPMFFKQIDFKGPLALLKEVEALGDGFENGGDEAQVVRLGQEDFLGHFTSTRSHQ